MRTHGPEGYYAEMVPCVQAESPVIVGGMRYRVTLDVRSNEPPREVDLAEPPNETQRATLDGRTVEIDAVAIGPNLSVRVDGHVVDLTLDGAPPEWGVVARGYRTRARVESDRDAAASLSAPKAIASGGPVVRSPMPGRVVRVLVAQGAPVGLGQGVVVLEAMKMENEVRASVAGTVLKVHVAAGDAVEASAKLVTLG
jgi:biotin carboxyl carrier protein